MKIVNIFVMLGMLNICNIANADPMDPSTPLGQSNWRAVGAWPSVKTEKTKPETSAQKELPPQTETSVQEELPPQTENVNLVDTSSRREVKICTLTNTQSIVMFLIILGAAIFAVGIAQGVIWYCRKHNITIE